VSAPARKQKNPGKKGGPKGPRKATILRRSAMMMTKSDGLKGEEACKHLTQIGVPLPSKRRQEIYEGDWVQWFKNESKAFYKQWHIDLKRGLSSNP